MAAKPTMRKRIMGSHLKRLREAARLPVEVAADEMNISRAAFYRHERGESSVSLAEAEKYLRVYEVTDQAVIDRVLGLARTSKAPGWWNAYGGIDGSVQAELAEMEDMARELWTHEDHVVPALIQTPAYSESIINLGAVDAIGRQWAKELITFRARRRAVMERAEVRGHFHFSFHETAMHTWAGDQRILTDQAAHIVNLIDAGHDIRMLPFSAGHISAHAKTSVLVSADDEGNDMIAFVQGFPIGSILHDEDAIAAIHAVFTALDANCLPALDTAQWLRDTFITI
jgi:transcriptional regulator with XRE-family HTH domain